LRSRGLELNQEKTHIVHVEEGFKFLWVSIPQFKISCFTIPQKEKVKEFLQTYKEGTTVLILHLLNSGSEFLSFVILSIADITQFYVPFSPSIAQNEKTPPTKTTYR
jgi:hypothetical protein